SMAQTMGMDAIAEGVETKEQLLELKKLRCPYAQGYLLAKPMDAAAAARFLSSIQIEQKTGIVEQIRVTAS
ncbi:MAG: EAL domain-containing protein, partial [Anaerolineaceae bacterium]|nr:EAL domain-containing protein [Anaerolineaceae bacterium]